MDLKKYWNPVSSLVLRALRNAQFSFEEKSAEESLRISEDASVKFYHFAIRSK